MTKQRGLGRSWTINLAITAIVKTTLRTTRPRCRQIVYSFHKFKKIIHRNPKFTPVFRLRRKNSNWKPNFSCTCQANVRIQTYKRFRQKIFWETQVPKRLYPNASLEMGESRRAKFEFCKFGQHQQNQSEQATNTQIKKNAKLTGRLAQLLSARYLSVREVWASIPRPVKSTQCRQRLATATTFLRSCVAQALSHGNGPRHLLYAST